MQVAVYHIPSVSQKSHLFNGSRKIAINSESLTKVALIDTNCSEIPKALDKAFILTQHLDSWYDNANVVCYKRTRSTDCGDILAAAGTWWMVAPIGFWKHGERWKFTSSPPPDPTPSDAVMGNKVINIPTGSVVLGGIEGAKRLFINANTSEEHQHAVAIALKYGDAGMDLIKTYGTQYCASVVSDNINRYYAAIFEATRIEGYQSLYWWLHDSSEPLSFEEATKIAIKLAKLKNIPFFWEIGHLVKAEFGWTNRNSNFTKPIIDFWYAINSNGSKIRFHTKDQFQGREEFGEPDRLCRIYSQIKEQWREQAP